MTKIVGTLKPEAKDHILKTLRSNLYTQHRGGYKGPADPKGCYCALGAAAVQLAKGNPSWTGQRLTIHNGQPYGGFSYALDLLGTMQVNLYQGDLAPITLEAYIARLNDEECLTFEQIADHLEKEIFPHV